MNTITIGATQIDYNLKLTDRKKTIGLEIDLHEGLSVYAPKHLSINEIETSLQRKSRWIIKKIDKIAEIKRNLSRKEFLPGEKFQLRGRNYRLSVLRKENVLPTLDFKKGKFIAEVPKNLSEEDFEFILRPLFLEFYYEKARQIIDERVNKYTKYLDKKPNKVRIKELKNKWGTCSSKNSISINWRLVFAKTSIIDYVVVHELCHLKHKNHSKKFWKQVESILPNYKNCKEWLRVNSDSLNI
ncbi:MAG: M48 family metallopeptidase [Candidatus Thermoplasmatota archaeon]|nr:M48 family metallopeptidase [Candidatus Thermoplasmatota archaeon]